jgi:hypothetical protein
VEVLISPEMAAAGIEALRAGRLARLNEGDLVVEIYLAMYCEAVKSHEGIQETLQ